MKADANNAADKAGTAIEDSTITAKVKTALIADPDVKGLKIDVDTKNGVVTLKGPPTSQPIATARWRSPRTRRRQVGRTSWSSRPRPESSRGRPLRA